MEVVGTLIGIVVLGLIIWQPLSVMLSRRYPRTPTEQRHDHDE